MGVMGDCSELFAKELNSGKANVKQKYVCGPVFCRVMWTLSVVFCSFPCRLIKRSHPWTTGS